MEPGNLYGSTSSGSDLHRFAGALPSTDRGATPAEPASLEAEIQRHVQSIRKIDSILKPTVHTLLQAALPAFTRDAPPPVPDWLTEHDGGPCSEDSFTAALCGATIQRLYKIRRRFGWLEDVREFSDRRLMENVAARFIPEPPMTEGDADSDRDYFARCRAILHSDTFGGMNPLTASQVFRVLMDAGEEYTHGGIGFVAFFSMVWPLQRRLPDPLNLGARMEPYEATAYITAKCLLPILTLEAVCRRRAELYDRAALIEERLEAICREDLEEKSPYALKWQFDRQTYELRTVLRRLAHLSIAPAAFRACEKAIRGIVLRRDADLADQYLDVAAAMREAVAATVQKSASVAREARAVIGGIQVEIVDRIEGSQEWPRTLSEEYGMPFPPEVTADPDCVLDLLQAAQKTLKICRAAAGELRRVGALNEHGELSSPQAVRTALRTVAESNRVVADALYGPLEIPSSWCRSVVDREIAHASALNVTEFNPAELVSAMVVALRSKLLTSPVQVRDAVAKTLVANQADGSWRLGHPFYSRDDVSGVRPPSSDIVWTLARAIDACPQATEADESLIRYVEWLDRGCVTFKHPVLCEVSGWGADRIRHGRKIHLVSTAYSINALLEIRDMVEYRLWQLCEKRFTVLDPESRLSDTDPVDFSSPPAERLHAVLHEMGRLTRKAAPEAMYSLVLHGPPGSSKTRLAEALAHELWGTSAMWGEQRTRLVRITPADFTRRGEDRIDSEARMIFELLSHVRSVTILFDEIDDLLTRRARKEDARPRFMDLVVPAMLNRLADLRGACARQEVSFVLGTNYVDHIEPALIRRGRIDRALAVVYPDRDSRRYLVGKTSQKARRGAGGQAASGGDAADADRIRRAADMMDAGREILVRYTAGMPWQTLVDTYKRVLQDLMRLADDPDAASVETILSCIVEEQKLGLSSPEYALRITRQTTCAELRNEYIRGMYAALPDPFDGAIEQMQHSLDLAIFPDGRPTPDAGDRGLQRARLARILAWEAELIGKPDPERSGETAQPAGENAAGAAAPPVEPGPVS
jgi:hypothetical protein